MWKLLQNNRNEMKQTHTIYNINKLVYYKPENTFKEFTE